ncbi:hypothetical protein [Clostridium niameyense]|uniref:hypothetical protein n=1 Tax=Clostridium niameyense TaxID=1622073 RepID=UPI00067E829A|nr:hypothetical protein [Clostridium niameyense]
MDIKLGINNTFTTENGEKLICYENSKRFAFLCPYKLLSDNEVELYIAQTRVYCLEEGDTTVEAIETMLVSNK